MKKQTKALQDGLQQRLAQQGLGDLWISLHT